jgi:hypothetical protein
MIMDSPGIGIRFRQERLMEHKDKVIVHPTSKGWSWTQVARNGRVSAIAPTTFDNSSNAKRAAIRQARKLGLSTATEDLDYVRQ